jgi:hypothetical protein
LKKQAYFRKIIRVFWSKKGENTIFSSLKHSCLHTGSVIVLPENDINNIELSSSDHMGDDEQINRAENDGGGNEFVHPGVKIGHEMPIHILPPIVPPYSAWARKTRIVLSARGITITDPAIIKTFVPLIIAGLPTYMSTLVPHTSLDELLKFLESYDRTPEDTLSIIDRYKILDSKPSIAFLLLVDEMTCNMRPGGDTESLKTLAWETIKKSLPPNMRMLMNLINVEYGYPTMP